MIGTWWSVCQVVAQGQSKRPDASDAAAILTWGSVLILAVLAASVVFALLRRRIYCKDPESKPDTWTLDGLRQLRADGLLTDAEYARLRQGVIDSVTRKLSGPAAAAAAPAATGPSAGPSKPAGDGDAAPPGGPDPGDEHPPPAADDPRAGQSNGDSPGVVE